MHPKIGVILGGRSAEKEVSQRSGEAVYHALLKKGYDAIKIQADDDLVQNLKSHQIQLAFIALHGQYGEDGTIQGLLEMLGIPYTGPGVLASALAMHKGMTKKILICEKIPTPNFISITQQQYQQSSLQSITESIQSMGLPVVFKPVHQGSSIGISFVDDAKEIESALKEAFKYDGCVIVEQKINGIELTAAVWGNERPEVLPLIEIVSATGQYDYQAKYTVGLSEHIIPPRISKAVQDQVRDIARRTYQALGCRGLSRIDFILDEKHNPYVLEVNTIPGMTETSLFPDAARAAGISFDELCVKLVQLAISNKESGG